MEAGTGSVDVFGACAAYKRNNYEHNDWFV